ncbi:hypothetical protein F53441_3320 [Fusarium austroafricanum]|uniref:Zn(2)-C6 fungal-type domain-containing protein n=1 Tax=Fusarium austroafricanum TaxID=2364996 RepID=A0A8H4KR95_9HYPO|nr:hypothetical protein F53441_3320 [Fusarium austroafricanum]
MAAGLMEPSGPVIKRRAAIACTRCRRMRSKCVHDRAQPPCRACVEAGVGDGECIFKARGEPDYDRNFRHPRAPAKERARRGPGRACGSIPDASVRLSNRFGNEWEQLPPLPEIIDGINQFTRHYFQLGFIPKEHFTQRLLNDHTKESVFLVVSILGISARLSRPLSSRYGSGMRASEFFMERATAISPGKIYSNMLEDCQAFYLLSIAQQGSGLRNESYMNMGIALRMASVLRLHLEETYRISNPTPAARIRGESARRTLWMLHSQDQLHSGRHSPISLAASDITALLPCDEDDFTNGREPPSRAALEGTPPAIGNQGLVSDINRSLFATLIQAHDFWGVIIRHTVNFTPSSHPWDPESKFAKVSKRLRQWENDLPQNHRWSEVLLSDYKSKSQDLAYLGVTMIPRLCNVVLRRPYLEDILTLSPLYTQKPAVFKKIAHDLFANLLGLYEQIDAQFTGRSSNESVGAQMAAFCVYTCGLFSIYLWRYPHICPNLNTEYDGYMMYQRNLGILMECKEVWPLASRWVDALESFAQDPTSSLTSETGMADGRDPIPDPVANLSTPGPTLSGASPASSIYSRQCNSLEPSFTVVRPSTNPHNISATLSATHITPSRFLTPQAKHGPQMHQLQILRPHQQPPPLSVMPQHQDFVPPQLQPQLYMSPNNMANFDMAMGTFGQNTFRSYPIALQCNPPLTASIPTAVAIPAVPIDPPVDGYADELNYYSYGPQVWVPTSNLFDGYS